VNKEQFERWCELYPSLLAKPEMQKPLIMGILNITPDSFSDGGQYYNAPQRAVARAQQMIVEGADIIDVGGESSRPGALPVSSADEMARVIPVIKALRMESDTCISIDTTKAEVMAAAVAAGASIVNDISALSESGSLTMAASLNIPICLMHMQGKPQGMQNNPRYSGDVVDEVNLFFQQRVERCLNAGIKKKHLILDPGFGFGKSPEHNLRLVSCFAAFQQHNLPLMLGVSRKSTLGYLTGKPVNERLGSGLAIALFAMLQGVGVIRTHDIAETHQVLLTMQAIKNDE
jgi:dihydropteroate synthase